MAARPTFEHELEQLNVDLIKMGALVEEAIENTILAFQNQDCELAKHIVEHDRQINDIEKSIEARSLSLIMRQQPVARDLRTVSTALKIVTDMERIGDQAADIAELLQRIHGPHIYNVVEHIPEMARNAKQMVHDAITAFVDKDLKLAKQVEQQDDVVDELFNRVKEEVVRIMKMDDAPVDHGVDFLMIAKYLERIGDHAVNICEWVEFSQTGELNNTKIL
jgi:phosphate transport system protein